jgi:hypothetical protein
MLKPNDVADVTGFLTDISFAPFLKILLKQGHAVFSFPPENL